MQIQQEFSCIMHSHIELSMKNALTLPIISRNGSTSVLLPELSPDAPVETIFGGGVFDGTDSQDRDINIHITEATLNAEHNRRLSQDAYDSLGDSPVMRAPEVRAGRKPAVSFGDECEIAYVADGTPVTADTNVRDSKDFDGNRSGRKSVKE